MNRIVFSEQLERADHARPLERAEHDVVGVVRRLAAEKRLRLQGEPHRIERAPETLDGLVAANSLHFVGRKQQTEVVAALATHLAPGGRFVVVEYDADRGNPWVPHPFSYAGWERLAESAGLTDTRRLGRVPSRFLDGIYSAESRRP